MINETVIRHNSTYMRWLVDDNGDSSLRKVLVDATNLDQWPSLDDVTKFDQIFSTEGAFEILPCLPGLGLFVNLKCFCI
jgi:hypothetical protein